MAQQMSVLGIDIAKQVFHGVGMDNSGARRAPEAYGS
jgi:hypothetical protein